MTEDEQIPQFFIHKSQRSVQYYLGFQAGLDFLTESSMKRWLDETFGEGPSHEKRVALLVIKHVSDKARVPTEAVLAAYEAAKAAGKVTEVDC